MVTAICLIKAEIDRIPEVAEVIAQMPAVSEVYSVTGDHDLVAIIRVRAHDELADVIPGGAQQGAGRDRDRDPHRVPHLLQARPRRRVRDRPVRRRLTTPPADRRRGGQNVRMAISAGAASRPAISSSRRLSVIDAPAMSSEVQYSPT